MEINLLVIRTQEPKILSKFYELLGINFEFHKHGNGPMHYSGKIGKLIFEIYPLQKDQKEVYNSLRMGFEVENLNQLMKTLKAAGIEIEKEPEVSEFGYIAVVKDIDGRKIELKEKES